MCLSQTHATGIIFDVPVVLELSVQALIQSESIPGGVLDLVDAIVKKRATKLPAKAATSAMTTTYVPRRRDRLLRQRRGSF